MAPEITGDDQDELSDPIQPRDSFLYTVLKVEHFLGCVSTNDSDSSCVFSATEEKVVQGKKRHA